MSVAACRLLSRAINTASQVNILKESGKKKFLSRKYTVLNPIFRVQVRKHTRCLIYYSNCLGRLVREVI